MKQLLILSIICMLFLSCTKEEICPAPEELDLFDELCNDPKLHLTMMLQQGDMQFVYNHAMLHDRTGFEDWTELEKRRHLLRLWLSVPGDRPLPEVFASRFGSIEIGNRGGIIVPGTQFCVPWRKDLAVN